MNTVISQEGSNSSPFFKKKWVEVDSLTDKGLYNMALAKTKEIFGKAVAEKNHNQVIKAIIHELKFNAFLEEEDFIKGIVEIEGLIEKTPSPSKEILHSLLAEMYYGYYSSNSWLFTNRTEVIDPDLSDIRTWDLKQIAKSVKANYYLSLQNAEIAQSTPISDFDLIINNVTSSANIRPTLYDFLAHRALNFFTNNTFNIPGSADTFTIDDPAYFGSNTSFLKTNESTSDALNTRFIAIDIFKKITKFHLDKKNETPLFYLEFERLKFVNQYATLADKDDLYYKNLQRIGTAHPDLEESSEVWYSIATIHNNNGSQYFVDSDTTNRWEKKSALNICHQVIENFPNSIGAQQCRTLINTIQEKSLTALNEQAVPANKKHKFLLNYKNLDKVHYKIIPYEYKKYRDERSSNRLEYIQQLNIKSTVFNATVPLVDPKDYQKHNSELLIPALEKGFYIIMVGTSANFDPQGECVAYFPMWSTNITYQYRNLNDKGELLVTNRLTGEPLVDATVEASYREYHLGAYRYKNAGKYTTNKNGKIEIPILENHKSLFFEVTYGKETYQSGDSFYGYRSGDERTSDETKLFTDRKIYRPGQEIFFKGILVEYNNDERKLLTNRSASVYFYDVNNQEIATMEVATNDFGSFEGKFTAPHGVLTGEMRISSGNGSTSFRVEEYKRPKFEVNLDPLTTEYKVNDSIKATGTAMAFAGNVIDGAAVNYRVVRTTQYSWRRYWGFYPRNEPKEIVNGSTVTDHKGTFTIDFKAIPDKESDPKSLPIFNYTIYADVIDINGETHSSSIQLNIGYQSLELGHNLNDAIQNDERFTLRIRTTNLSGATIPVKGSFKIEKLETPEVPTYQRLWTSPDQPLWSEKEFKSNFPTAVYHNENEYFNWSVADEKIKGNFDTEKSDSVYIKDFAKWKPGVYKYSATAKDKNGIEIEDEFYFTVFNQKAKIIPTNATLWVKPLKLYAEPGEEVQILLGTAEEDLTVYYEIEHKNAIVKSEKLVLSKDVRSLKIQVKEEYRGNFTVHFNANKNNRSFKEYYNITVPYTNKKLDLSFSTFRNKLLPGQEEEWTLNIKNSAGLAEQAELLATLYDASLDVLYTTNYYGLNLYPTDYGRLAWGNSADFNVNSALVYQIDWNDRVNYQSRYFAELNYFEWRPNVGRYQYNYGWANARSDGNIRRKSMNNVNAESAPIQEALADYVYPDQDSLSSDVGLIYPPEVELDKSETKQDVKSKTNKEDDLGQIKARENFNETAFFFPQITTDKKGDIQLKFTMPESLTKWKFLGMAHTKDLKTGSIIRDVVTQKELMVVPNVPRFLREGDKMVLSSKISNISDADLRGQVALYLIDLFTEESVATNFLLEEKPQEFTVGKGQSTVVSWTVKIPFGLNTVKYKIVAKADDFSDGEENVLPILSNRMLVTESLPLPIRGQETKTFKLDKLINSTSSHSLKNHNYTLEFTSNPAWYAVQAMPYMMEYPHECAEQIFTRYYSNTIATHIMNSSPKIKQIVEDWGANSPDAFLSNLQKNQELKAVMLEETPWVLDAKNEAASKKNLSVLLDMNRMSREMDIAFKKLSEMQLNNGAWAWFKGMHESRYITQHIVTGMGHLDNLGIKDIRANDKQWRMVKAGVQYLDKQIVQDYAYIKRNFKDRMDDQHIGYYHIQYLYARSYFTDIKMDASTEEAVNYFKKQAAKYWLKFNIYAEGMIALAAHRFEMTELASDIVKSLKDRAIYNDEMGMYWKSSFLGYNWYEAPIETHALMIEMFDEVANDEKSVEELKIWLLKQKQTTNWKTTKQTTEAVYALLLKGTDLLASDEMVKITIGGKEIEYTNSPEADNPYQVRAEAGTGYFKTNWNGTDIRPEMGNITVSKANKGVAWGAVYWQYFENMDKITFAETNVKLNKELFLVEITNEGEKLKRIADQGNLKVGDKVRVRIELRSDRNLEYVHMKDMRAAGFEPIDVLSTYKYQGGLGYYQSTKDAATHFFFDYVQKGTYVFEYDLRVQHAGDFANGITSIQCMYAPEFTAHSDGIRVVVE